MKLYHYALFFALVCVCFFITAHIALRVKMQEESVRKTEYDCLVAAVDAAVGVVFDEGERSVTKFDLKQAEDVFFQTLEVLWFGTTDRTSKELVKARVPCIVVFSEEGYYLYCFEKENGYGWSEVVPYEQGEIPICFFDDTEKILTEYHDIHYKSLRKYRMEQVEKGIWEQELSPPCVFAVYAPVNFDLSKEGRGFVYAASDYCRMSYYVTIDNRCHLPFCTEYINGEVIACYSTQKESAEAGAMPCEKCMR